MTESKNPGITRTETDYCPFMKATISGLSGTGEDARRGDDLYPCLQPTASEVGFFFFCSLKRTLGEGRCFAGADLSVIPP